MRIHEIIGDTWETRFASHQRQQAKRTKLRGKLVDVQAKSYQQHRRAVDQQARTNDKLRSIKSDLATVTKRPPSQ